MLRSKHRLSPDRAVLLADAARPSTFHAGDGEEQDVPKQRFWPPRRSAPLHGLGPTAPGGDGVKTLRERAEEKRQLKLEQVQEMVEDGSLVIRQMTEDERRRYPRRPALAGRRGRG
jgi:hypothetical protein